MFQYPEAFWASSSAWAAWCLGVFGLLANGVGLFFIFRQLKATDDNAKAALLAARAAVMETRPWIRVKFMSRATLKNDVFSLRVDWQNTGATPAVGLQVHTIRLHHGEPWEAAFERAMRYQTDAGVVLFQGDEDSLWHEESVPLPQEAEHRVLAVITYRMSGSPQMFVSPETAIFRTRKGVEYFGVEYFLEPQQNHRFEPT